MANYQEFLDSIDRKAYHEGESQWEEDGFTVTRTYHYSPPGCHDSCGILIYTDKDGKVVKVEGDPLDPCANGRLCIKCLTLPEAINHPDRVKYPMRRVGERGENKWERISWEDAYDEIEKNVRDIWETDGGNAIVCVHGTGRNINWQVPYFGQAALKTPNISTFGFTGFACYMPRVCGAIAPFGDFPIADASQIHADRYAHDEWVVPECIVIWGNEPLTSNGDGFIGHWLVQCVQMGAKIIDIDPRVTWWAARADYHLQIRPGTDAALANAWLKIIMEEGLYDEEFVSYWCDGFDKLYEGIKEYTPEYVSGITGLSVEDIIGSARLYATSKPAMIQWGLAFDQQMSAMSVNLAACDLMALTGNLDAPGGNVLVRNAFEMNAGYSSGEEYTPTEWREKKLNFSYCFGGKGADFVAHATSDGILQAMEDANPYPIKMFWVESSNTLSCPSMDAPRVYEAMKKVPFVVVADPFLTPTAVAFADIVLPVAMSAERNSCRTWWQPLRAMKKVSQYYEAKSDEQIIVELGNRLNPEAFGQWQSDIDMLNWYLHDGTGSGFGGTTDVDEVTGHTIVDKTLYHKDFDQLVTEDCCHAYDEFNSTYKKYAKGMLRGDGGVGFGTATGRVELSPYAYKVWGLTPTPWHQEPVQSPISTPELLDEYPLILTCGGRSYEFFHSEHRQLPTMRELHPQPRVTINPVTAEKFGIQENDWVWVENDHGRFKQQALVRPTVNENTVHAEHGWWFPEEEPAFPSYYKTFESNPNNCTRAFETGEGGVGSSIKSMLCKIYKVQDDDMPANEQVILHGGFNKKD